MMKNLVLLLLAIAVLATAGSVTKGGTLTATCQGCGGVGDPLVIINGTGYQNGAHNSLSVVVWDSSNPVYCGTPDKNGNFQCTTTIDAPGWYNIVAYENSRTIIAATGILIY